MLAIFAYLKYLPVVLAAVVGVEQTVASEVPGATKKQIIMDSIHAAMAAVSSSLDPAAAAIISTLIDAVVGTLNLVGIFKKAPKV